MTQLRYLIIALAFGLPLMGQTGLALRHQTAASVQAILPTPFHKLPVDTFHAQWTSGETQSPWFYDDVDDEEWEEQDNWARPLLSLNRPLSLHAEIVWPCQDILPRQGIKLFILFCCFKLHC